MCSIRFPYFVILMQYIHQIVRLKLKYVYCNIHKQKYDKVYWKTSITASHLVLDNFSFLEFVLFEWKDTNKSLYFIHTQQRIIWWHRNIRSKKFFFEWTTWIHGLKYLFLSPRHSFFLPWLDVCAGFSFWRSSVRMKWSTNVRYF